MLQAVESLILNENKENIPQDKSFNDSNSFSKAAVSPKILSPKTSLHQNALSDTKENIKALSRARASAGIIDDQHTRKADADLAKTVADKLAAEVRRKVEEEYALSNKLDEKQKPVIDDHDDILKEQTQKSTKQTGADDVPLDKDHGDVSVTSIRPKNLDTFATDERSSILERDALESDINRSRSQSTRSTPESIRSPALSARSVSEKASSVSESIRSGSEPSRHDSIKSDHSTAEELSARSSKQVSEYLSDFEERSLNKESPSVSERSKLSKSIEEQLSKKSELKDSEPSFQTEKPQHSGSVPEELSSQTKKSSVLSEQVQSSLQKSASHSLGLDFKGRKSKSISESIADAKDIASDDTIVSDHIEDEHSLDESVKSYTSDFEPDQTPSGQGKSVRSHAYDFEPDQTPSGQGKLVKSYASDFEPDQTPSGQGKLVKSYTSDFEPDYTPSGQGKSSHSTIASKKSLSYSDDFEADISDRSSVKSQRSSLKPGSEPIEPDLTSKGKELSHKEGSSKSDLISEQLSVHSDDVQDAISSAADAVAAFWKEEGEHEDEERLEVPQQPVQSGSLTASDLESSEAEIIPQPPKVDLDALADSLTSSLMGKLLKESITSLQTALENKAKHQGSSEIVCGPDNEKSDSGHLSTGQPQNELPSLKSEENDRLSDKKPVLSNSTSDEVSEDLSSAASERSESSRKSDTFLKFGSIAFPDENDEAFVTPKETATVSIDKPEVVAFDQENIKQTDSAKESISKEESKRTVLAESDIDVTARQLLKEAISQMIEIKTNKAQKLVQQEEPDEILADEAVQKRKQEKSSEKPKDTEHSSLLELVIGGKDKEDLADADALKSPPTTEVQEDAFLDSALLTARLNELKNMHQEIGELLGDESDDEDGFVVNENRDILTLPDNEPDIIPPVPDYDFGEPIIFVPYSRDDTNGLVADAADIIFSKLNAGDDIVNIEPDSRYLQVEENDDDFEASCKKCYKQMIFEVTRELLREIIDFRGVQTKPRPPWMKPPKRIFPKFIHRAHKLKGEELLTILQQHVCTCVGLKDGRPTLDQLKRRLPLNTAKKDYVDAILVEELREEEPQWVNYDEDELRVKHQLTNAILDNLIAETVSLLREIESRRTSSDFS